MEEKKIIVWLAFLAEGQWNATSYWMISGQTQVHQQPIFLQAGDETHTLPRD